MALAERERLLLSRFLDGECSEPDASRAAALLDRSPEAQGYLTNLVHAEDAVARTAVSPGGGRLPWLVAAALLLAVAAGLVIAISSGGENDPAGVPVEPRIAAPELPPPPAEIEAVGTVAGADGLAEIRRGGRSIPAIRGTEVARGDRLIVPDEAFLEFDLEDGVRFSLAPDSECLLSEAGTGISLLSGALGFSGDRAAGEWRIDLPNAGAAYRVSGGGCGYLLLSPPVTEREFSLTVHLARGEITAAEGGELAALSGPCSRRIRFRGPGEEELTVTVEWGAEGFGGRIDEKLFLLEVRERGEEKAERYQILTWPRLSYLPRLAVADLLEQGRALKELPPIDRGAISGMRAKGLLDEPLTSGERGKRVARFLAVPRPPRPARTVAVAKVVMNEGKLMALIGAPVRFPKRYRGKVFLFKEEQTIAPETLLITIAKWLKLGVRLGPEGYTLVQQ